MRAIIIVIILLFALTFRLYTVVTALEYPQVLVKDAAAFDTIAWNLVAGRGFSLEKGGSRLAPTTNRPPGYPFFLAGIYLLFGHNLVAVWIVQSFIGVLLCLIIFLISKEIFNFLTGSIALLISSIYPAFINYQYYGGPTFVLSELLFTFLLSLAILFLINYIKNRSYQNIIIAGIILGICALTKPMITYFPIFLFFWFFIIKNKTLNWKRHLLIFYFSFILVILPWTLRNYLVSGEFVFINSMSGESFWDGNNSLARGGIISSSLTLPEYNPKDFVGLNEAQRDSLKFKKGLEFLLKHPKQIPALFLKKILVHWGPLNEDRQINYFYFLIGALAFMGIFDLFFKKKMLGISLILLLLGYATVIAMLVAGDPRYRFPMEPYLIIFASYFITQLRLKKSSYSKIKAEHGYIGIQNE